MAYQLPYTKKALKDIKKLDRVAQKRLKKSLEKFALKPFYYAVKLTDAKLGEYRWQAGDYRIVFDKKNTKLIILRIGHRREIYQGNNYELQ